MFFFVPANELIFNFLSPFSAGDVSDQYLGKKSGPANGKIQKRQLCPDSFGKSVFLDWIITDSVLEDIIFFLIQKLIEMVRLFILFGVTVCFHS